MFRLKESQLHMVMWLMVVASLLFFAVFGMVQSIQVESEKTWQGMDDFSDGWICTYETTDMEKLETYQRENGFSMESDEGQEKDYTIVEVVTFPATLSVQKDTVIKAMREVPDVELESLYVTLKTDDAMVKVLVEKDIIYASHEQESGIPVRHRIPILPEYKGKMMTIEISEMTEVEMEITQIQSGSYNQLWVTMLQEHGISIGIGILLILCSICMLLIWKMTKNTRQQKRLLFYSCIEGILLGTMCLLAGDMIPMLTGWNLGTYILRAFGILIAIVLHLTIIRCFVYKKKVVTVIDSCILLTGVLYISGMVLQVFSLIEFDTIYFIGAILYSVMVVLFTVILAITIFDYKKKEGMPVFIANVFLILCMLAQVVMVLAGRQDGGDYVYVRIGCLLYMIYIWIYGLKQAFMVQPKGEEIALDTNQLRTQVIEQMNPNLLFASFHTLQGLIKNGSDKSVKMIYYISVYFRDNLRALEAEGEIISFKEELEHMIAYLQLQKTRNSGLDFAIECKEKDFRIPRHSLMPLVENAVKHGIAQHENQGNVAIRTYTRADGYAIQIIDDGAGFDTQGLRRKTTTLTKTLSLLENVCRAKTEVISKTGKGTVITIILPMLENDLLSDAE